MQHKVYSFANISPNAFRNLFFSVLNIQKNLELSIDAWFCLGCAFGVCFQAVVLL
jgi:hypothetical protein